MKRSRVASKMSKILYNDRPEIGLGELSHIYLSLVFSAKTIYINRNTMVSRNQSKKCIEHIEDNLYYLKERGMVKYWTYPFDIPSQSSPDVEIVPVEEYNIWEQIINETFLSGKNLISLLNLINELGRSQSGLIEERTSKIIIIKKEYWAFAICSALKLDQILNSYGNFQPKLIRSKKYDFSRIKEPLIEKLFSKFDIPDLSVLNGPDVHKLQKKGASFRSLINTRIVDQEGHPDAEIVENVFNDLCKDIFELCNNYIDNSGPRTFVDNTLMAFISLWLSFFSFLPIGNDFFNELWRRKNYGFIYLMSQIKNTTNKKMKKQ
jgi:hypothetical protein